MFVWHKMYWQIADKVCSGSRFYKVNTEFEHIVPPSSSGMYGVKVQSHVWKITETQKTGPKGDVKRSYSSSLCFWAGSVYQWVLRRTWLIYYLLSDNKSTASQAIYLYFTVLLLKSLPNYLIQIPLLQIKHKILCLKFPTLKSLPW